MKIKKGDKIQIIKGRDRGKSGKITRALPSKLMVVVEGLNLRKKAVKPKRAGEKGRIVSVAWPMRVENVMIVCGACNKPTRVGYKDKKRYCKKCKAAV